MQLASLFMYATASPANAGLMGIVEGGTQYVLGVPPVNLMAKSQKHRRGARRRVGHRTAAKNELLRQDAALSCIPPGQGSPIGIPSNRADCETHHPLHRR